MAMMGRIRIVKTLRKKLNERESVEDNVAISSIPEPYLGQNVTHWSIDNFKSIQRFTRIARAKVAAIHHASSRRCYAFTPTNHKPSAGHRLNLNQPTSSIEQNLANHACCLEIQRQPHPSSQDLASRDVVNLFPQPHKIVTNPNANSTESLVASATNLEIKKCHISMRHLEDRSSSEKNCNFVEEAMCEKRAQIQNMSDDPGHRAIQDGKDSLIGKLPTEILLCIADFLPLSSAATLALCSRELLRKLGTGPFRAVARGARYQFSESIGMQSIEKEKEQTAEQKDCESFLATMFENHPQLVYCYHCKTAHDPKDTLLDVQHGKRPCSIVKARCHNRWLLEDEFTFPRVQLIMNHHRRGTNPLGLSKQLKPLVATFTHYLTDFLTHQKYTEQISYRPRIRFGKLLLRTHRWFLFRSDLPPTYKLQICPHLHGYYKRFGDITKCKISHQGLDVDQCKSCSGTHKCDVCATEYQLDYMTMSDGFRVLAFTSWRDFGEGRTPFDPKWEKHCLTSSSVKQITPVVQLNSIKREFGDNENFCFDDHMTEQLWDLLEIGDSYHTIRS